MVKITFPDGKSKKYETGITGIEVAKDISVSLAKEAVAILINGNQKDLSDPIIEDSPISIITLKDDAGLEIMRHTLTAQVLARAVKNLYPEASLGIGPTIENGFYYDVLFEQPISIDDLSKIEDEMRKIIKEGHIIKKLIKTKDQAINLFKERNEPYKIKIIEESDQSDNFQIYKQGEADFFDLCKGPHLQNLQQVGEFKLTKLSGAYWRGNSKNEMLQRIYGTAWRSKKELKDYLSMLDEAEKRDHRKLGKEMGLFHFQDDAPGSVFWHPKGWLIFRELIKYMRRKQDDAGYIEISTPTVMDRSLWEKSGHWEKFQKICI